MTLNLTPRKCLQFRSPLEAFLAELGEDRAMHVAGTQGTPFKVAEPVGQENRGQPGHYRSSRPNPVAVMSNWG